jgi:glycosyltransferase involved in cell wall biosynthesis
VSKTVILSPSAPLAVVAIPAKNEAKRIGACLAALQDQRDLDGRRLPPSAFKMVVLANDCSDNTANAARAMADPRVKVVELRLPSQHANAGGARRAAMEAAMALLPDGRPGLVCTTDADSRPRPDWLAQILKSIQAGAQAVAGAVDFEPEEAQTLRFSALRRLEGRYAALQAEVMARVDPETHNPWPNHIWAWGANLAVTADAYRRVGGLPPAPLAEDRAFIDALRRHDVPVRHCLEARVWTSARRQGRAPGGLASLVDDHVADDSAPCDCALEPIFGVYVRASLRRRLRAAYANLYPPQALSRRLAINPVCLHQALAQPTFGAAWSLVEAASPRLSRRRLALSDLPVQVRWAERLLGRLTPPGEDDQRDRDRAASAGLWSASPPPR